MLRWWRWGPGRGGRATVTTERVEAPAAAGPSTARSDGPGGRDAGDAAEVGLVSGRSVVDPGRRGWWGRGGRACR
jgi:hypothetical protein